MPLTSRQVRAIRYKRAVQERARELAHDADIGALCGLDDPEAVYKENRRLVAAYMGRDCQTYCLDCAAASGFNPPVPWQSEADVPCAACGRAVQEAL